MLPHFSDRRGPLPRLFRYLSEPTLGALLFFVALLPVIYVWIQAVGAHRNVPYWDELDSAIAFVIRLDRGQPWDDTVQQLFALTNEHRTVTSRLIFALSYWLTGTVNFFVFAIIGNLFISAFCLALVMASVGVERRLRLGLLLGCFIFSLEHCENFYWAGSSIDHFQVVLLAGGALLAMVRGTPVGFVSALLLALLASLTLTHGFVAWPVAAVMLAREQRWRQLGVWLVVGAVTVVLFLQGFGFNSAHGIGDVSPGALWRIVHYWLVLIGAPVALGHVAVAPWFGLLLLGLIGRLALRRTPPETERWVLPIAGWAIFSLLLVAIGRAAVNNGVPISRYYILGAVAWALGLFAWFDLLPTPERRHKALVAALPFLVAFNLAANLHFAPVGKTWTFIRNVAADSYIRQGSDGHRLHKLHPSPEHATRLLHEAEKRGVYRMPLGSEEVRIARPRPTPKPMEYFVDRILVDDRLVVIEGWAAFPKERAKLGQIRVILASADTQRFFTTVPANRYDVAQVYPDENWVECGFRFEYYRDLLAPESFQLGLLIASERDTDFVMTDHRVDLRGYKQDLIANAR